MKGENKVMLIDENLLIEREHLVGGVQRIYKLPNGYGLSAVNTEILHGYKFAWEFAVLENIKEVGGKITYDLTYDTELTQDVEVFQTTTKANEFILKAFDVLAKL